jgi:hypothetical protein
MQITFSLLYKRLADNGKTTTSRLSSACWGVLDMFHTHQVISNRPPSVTMPQNSMEQNYASVRYQRTKQRPSRFGLASLHPFVPPFSILCPWQAVLCRGWPQDSILDSSCWTNLWSWLLTKVSPFCPHQPPNTGTLPKEINSSVIKAS